MPAPRQLVLVSVVDVEARSEGLATDNAQQQESKASIVDLLKLLD